MIAVPFWQSPRPPAVVKRLIFLIILVGSMVFVSLDKPRAGISGPLQTEIYSIILHSISGPACSNGRVVYSGAPGNAARWKTFFDNHPFLGIHYVIDRDGNVEASTPENRKANHALGNNDGSIGIELVHNGDGTKPFSDKLFEALVKLIRDIQLRHRILPENIKSHAEVDARTFWCGGKFFKSRVDPGPNFPWSKLRAVLETASSNGEARDSAAAKSFNCFDVSAAITFCHRD
jgi:N-acetyl-anhydromuramyl-L-alanine amidase AmpD